MSVAYEICTHSLSPYMFLSEQVIGIPFDFVSEKDVGLTNASHQTSPGAGKDADGTYSRNEYKYKERQRILNHPSITFICQ